MSRCHAHSCLSYRLQLLRYCFECLASCFILSIRTFGNNSFDKGKVINNYPLEILGVVGPRLGYCFALQHIFGLHRERRGNDFFVLFSATGQGDRVRIVVKAICGLRYRPVRVVAHPAASGFCIRCRSHHPRHNVSLTFQ
jgi:hypothetical protein